MRPSRFDCRDVDRLLDLEDVGRRPDRRALSRHLARCARCRALAPELEWFYGRVEARRRSGPGFRVAAAGLVAATLLLGLITIWPAARREPVTATEPVGPRQETSPRLLPAHHSHFEAGTIRMLPDQEQHSSNSRVAISPENETARQPAPMEWTR